MKKLLFIISMIASSVAIGATTYDGEKYEFTKATAPSKSVYMMPSNVVNIAKKQLLAWPLTLKALNFWMGDEWPSSVAGSFNINLGIDNVVGDPLQAASKTAYSVAVGTSDRATKMHSYTFGSQLNSLAAVSTVIGYGNTSTSDWSTVIGHGKRPDTGSGYDKNFTTTSAMTTWLQTYDPDVFPGVHFKDTSTGKVYTIVAVSSTPDDSGYYYRYLETNPEVVTLIPKNTVLPSGTVFYTNTITGVRVKCVVGTGATYKIPDTNAFFVTQNDYIPGGYDWRYGKSHGPGTFNIVAYHSRWGKTSPGMKAVYINDDCLENLVDAKIKTVAPAALGPQEMVLDEDQIVGSYDDPIEILSGSTVTILPTTNLNSGSELAIEPKDGGLRNYEVYLPNEPEIRAGLPCGFDLSELPEGIRYVYVNGIHMVPTLPAKLTVRQPYSKLVIGEIVALDDGWDWNPVITNCNAVWNGTSLAAPGGKKLFEGTCLQAGMSLKVAYPISGGTIVTNDVHRAADISGDGWLVGTFYEYVSGFDFIPPSGQSPASSGGSPVTFTYIYETKAGKVPATWTYTFDPSVE